MKSPLGAGVAFLAVVAAALAAYFAGLHVAGRGLSPAERAEIDGLVAARLDGAATETIAAAVADYLAANPVAGTVAAMEQSEEQTVFGARVREFLITNPEVINEAITELERKRAEEEVARRAAAVEDNRELLFSSPRQVVLGNAEGDVTLVEFFDYNCSYCRRAHGDMLKLLDEDQDLRIVLKEFPVLGPASIEAAEVGIAVNIVSPESYREFHDLLLTSDSPANGEIAMAAAESLGIDRAALDAAREDPEVRATIEESYQLASALGLTGTPSYVVQNQVVVGAVGYDQLAAQIATFRD